MSAQRIAIFTIDFPDPHFIDYDNNQFQSLNESLGFRYNILNNIQTLSTKGIDPDQDPFGILYVPQVYTSGCKEAQAQYVPANATRLENLPSDKDYALIAVAPWYSPQCTIEYFTEARKHSTKAFITYLPGDSNAKPPVLNDAAWNLEDGGSWQSRNNFPTYAVSSMTGSNIMDQLNLYSGNLSDVPHADQLSQIYNTTDYIRLWANIGTDSTSQLPSLWVFLVIVLAILLVAVSFTSVVMHIIQRRRRNDLRQRVLNGQVDLEALGVKRLNVSQQVLDKLPIHTFSGRGSSHSEKANPEPLTSSNAGPSSAANAETGHKPTLTRHSSAPELPKSSMSSSWSQPTCPICMDDFEPNESQVRELPCHHIFHPECIDPFLLGHSSLCPMCKRSVLPTGVCPVKITNIMVRRERHINRIRARSARAGNAQPSSTTAMNLDPSASPASPARPTMAQASLGSRIGGAITGRRIFSAPHRTQSRPSDIEMAMTSPSGPPAPHLPANASSSQQFQNCDPAQSRREWARQRALAMLGPHQAPTSDEDEEQNLPKWRRILRKVFPT
ncbi:hypothetical protein COCVIDRAFT_40356 [Bipolaris victoriae FI3]|uniref:RING-type domain-containing protein n=1 Tax=Bipolaris victoriae (strain FI3) TaxID=930091 RepID=W7EE54_BIPV3|nr:hypothetical protein COCVIDRAFT_40356 [Bipolaris victoriae FI3]